MLNLADFRNTINFNGQVFTPHFYILKNGAKITRHFKGEKSTNFTYSQAMQYNEVVKGEVCFNGYQVDNHNLLIKEL